MRRDSTRDGTTGGRPTSKRLLKDYEVEAQYGISRFTLRADRLHERRFTFVKLGRSVYYRVDDIEAMLEAHVMAGLAPKKSGDGA